MRMQPFTLLTSMAPLYEGIVAVLGLRDKLTFVETYSALIIEGIRNKDIGFILENCYSLVLFQGNERGKGRNKRKVK